MVFVFEQKTAYEVRISDWSSDVCSSDLLFASSNNHALASSTGAGIDRANALEATSSAAPRLTIHFFILLLFSLFSSLQAATGSRPCDRLPRAGDAPAHVKDPCGQSGPAIDPWHDRQWGYGQRRSEEHTSELQSLMRISYAVFCLKKKK